MRSRVAAWRLVEEREAERTTLGREAVRSFGSTFGANVALARRPRTRSERFGPIKRAPSARTSESRLSCRLPPSAPTSAKPDG